MIRPLRTVFAALFLMSMFCMVSCNRNCCDAFCSPCVVQCPPICDPCQSCPPRCDPCPPSCIPCQPTPQCDTSYPAPLGQLTCAPCSGTLVAQRSPYFPCDPSAVPCGNNSGGGTYSQCGTNTPCATGSCDSHNFSERCYRNMRTTRTCDECVVELVQRSPEFATVGAAYPIEIMITARKECADVIVHQTLPRDSEFVRSDPPVTPDQNGALRWEFPHMMGGETQRICVWVRPLKEGCCVAAATICACPQLCSATNCVQPVLCVKKWGPECVCLYCPACYTIEVCNSGSGTAYDVVLTDNIPDGLQHASGMQCLTYQLGDLCPGDSRRINIDLCAIGEGRVTNMACVSYCGGPKCCAEWSTLINQPCVEVTKTGPDWAYICKVVDYTITVTNPCNLVLRNVCIDDVSPPGTTVVNAPGAEICCNRAVWCIPEFCPGETLTFVVSVRSQTAGCLTNKVTVTAQSDCGQFVACAEAPTCWRGISAVHMCMVDTCDPLCVGDTTVYRVCVTNRGTAEDSNIRLALNFTNELQPMCANGPTNGTIAGQSVTFYPIDRLAPQQSVEFCVTVKGVAPGSGRADATLSSDALGAPIHDTETTHVY
jgi:uncharacterized repeat protein (TIGR01451 family)